MTEKTAVFHKHTKRTNNKDGSYTVRCKLGLWSVTSPTSNQAEAEAMHYFSKYWQDGEYADNPLEALAYWYKEAK